MDAQRGEETDLGASHWKHTPSTPASSVHCEVELPSRRLDARHLGYLGCGPGLVRAGYEPGPVHMCKAGGFRVDASSPGAVRTRAGARRGSRCSPLSSTRRRRRRGGGETGNGSGRGGPGKRDTPGRGPGEQQTARGLRRTDRRRGAPTGCGHGRPTPRNRRRRWGGRAPPRGEWLKATRGRGRESAARAQHGISQPEALPAQGRSRGTTREDGLAPPPSGANLGTSPQNQLSQCLLFP